jgi:hypothetical protein
VDRRSAIALSILAALLIYGIDQVWTWRAQVDGTADATLAQDAVDPAAFGNAIGVDPGRYDGNQIAAHSSWAKSVQAADPGDPARHAGRLDDAAPEFLDRFGVFGRITCAAVIDIDGDGRNDLLIMPAAGEGDGLAYRCMGYSCSGVPFFADDTNGVFSGTTRLAAGTHSLLVADFDNDGRDDFLAMGPDPGIFTLYRNTRGMFADVTAAAGLDDLPPGATGAVWVDLDGDGYLDLLVKVTVWLERSSTFQLKYYRNVPKEGGGRAFTDATMEAGLAGAGSFSLTPLWAAAALAVFDGDGYLDIGLASTAGN